MVLFQCLLLYFDNALLSLVTNFKLKYVFFFSTFSIFGFGRPVMLGSVFALIYLLHSAANVTCDCRLLLSACAVFFRLRPSTPCTTVLIIWQLFHKNIQHHGLKLDSNKANLTAEGHRLDNHPGPSMPCWRPCTNLFFLLEY